MQPPRILLGVNIDHIATLRQARGTRGQQCRIADRHDTCFERPPRRGQGQRQIRPDPRGLPRGQGQ